MAGLAGNEVQDAPKEVSVGVGQTAAITENLQEALSGTVGGASYPFRVALAPIVFTPATAYQDRATDPGTILRAIELDDLEAEDPMIKALKEKFMAYTFKDLTIVLKCASPFSTASGTVELAFNPDPSNPISSTTPADAMQHVMRLTKSQQISAKTDAVIQIPNSQLADPIYGNTKRYCKRSSTSIPRMERFGQVVICMRTEPAKGDGSQWAVSLMGSVEFSGPTFNSSNTLVKYVHPFTVDDQVSLDLVEFKGAYTLKVELDATGKDIPAAVGDAVFFPPVDVIFKASDADNVDIPVEEYRQSYSQCQFSKDEDSNLFLHFPTQMGTVTSFSNPQCDEIIANDCTANLLYMVEASQYKLVCGERVGPQDLKFIPEANLSQPFTRRAALAHQYHLPKQSPVHGQKVFTWFKDRFL